MADIFSKITDTAIMAGWAVLAVIVLRLIFRNTSSRLKCAMWAIVALRLILWFPIESRFAVLPAFSVKQMITDMALKSDAELPAENDLYSQTDNGFTSQDETGTGSHSESNMTAESYNEINSELTAENIARGNTDAVNNATAENEINVVSDAGSNTEQDTEMNTVPNAVTKTEKDTASNAAQGIEIITEPDNQSNSGSNAQSDPGSAYPTNMNDDSTDGTRDYEQKTIEKMQRNLDVAGWIWFVGTIIFLCYALISSVKLHRRLKTAVIREGQPDVYMSEFAISPFVFGMMHPSIYMGFGISDTDVGNVIAHERMHIRRKDHIFKLLAYILLAMYWFVPWIWLAYWLYCRDTELACDEAVIQEMDGEKRADYSRTLLHFATLKSNRIFCPISFGEIGIKARVKNILNYRKKPVWIAGIAATVCVVVAVILFLVPLGTRAQNDGETSKNSGNSNTGGLQLTDREKELREHTEAMIARRQVNETRLNGTFTSDCQILGVAEVADGKSILTSGTTAGQISEVKKIDLDAYNALLGAGTEEDLMNDIITKKADPDALYLLKADRDKSLAAYAFGDGERLAVVHEDKVCCFYLWWGGMHHTLPTIEFLDADSDGDDEIVIITHTGTGSGYSVSDLYIMKFFDNLQQAETSLLLKAWEGTNGTEAAMQDVLAELKKDYDPESGKYKAFNAKPNDHIAVLYEMSEKEIFSNIEGRTSVGCQNSRIGFALDGKTQGWVYAEIGYELNPVYKEGDYFTNKIDVCWSDHLYFDIEDEKIVMSLKPGIYDHVSERNPNASKDSGYYKTDYSPNLKAAISFSPDTGFRIVDPCFEFPVRLNWNYDVDVIHSDMIDHVFFESFGDEYRKNMLTYGFRDIDGEGTPEYAIFASELLSDEYKGYVGFYLNGEKIYEYYDRNVKFFPSEAVCSDLDGDGENEIILSFYTTNKSEMTKYTVLKKDISGWSEIDVSADMKTNLKTVFPMMLSEYDTSYEGMNENGNTDERQTGITEASYRSYHFEDYDMYNSDNESIYDNYGFTWDELKNRQAELEVEFLQYGILKFYLIRAKAHAYGTNCLLAVLWKDGEITDYAFLPGDMPGYQWMTDYRTDMLEFESDPDRFNPDKSGSDTENDYQNILYLRQGWTGQGVFTTSFFGKVFVREGKIWLEPDTGHYNSYLVHYNPYWK